MPGCPPRQVRHGGTIRDARSQLRGALNDSLKVSEEADPADASLRASVERLAFLCDQLGWGREAKAWRQLLPGATPADQPADPIP